MLRSAEGGVSPVSSSAGLPPFAPMPPGGRQQPLLTADLGGLQGFFGQGSRFVLLLGSHYEVDPGNNQNGVGYAKSFEFSAW